MNADKDLEKAFRKLSGVSSEVPDKMWAAIQAKIRRRKRIIGFLFIPFVLLLAVSVFLISNNNKVATSIQTNKSSKQNFTSNQKNKISRQQVMQFINHDTNESITANNSADKKIFFTTKPIFKTQPGEPVNQAKVSTVISNKLFSNNNNKDLIREINKNEEDKNAIAENKKLTAKNFNNDDAKKDKDDNKDQDPLSVLIFASPDFPFQKLNYTDTLGVLVKNSSFMRLSFSVGTRVQYNFTSHFSGSIGVQYSQVNDKLNTGSNVFTTHYKTLDLPLLAGYRFISEKFNTKVTAGIILNITASRKSNISDASPYPYYFQKDDAYKSNSSISYYAAINFNFNANKKLSLFAEPYFKYRPSNLAKPAATFNQKINTAGILIGVKYDLFDKGNPDSSAQ